MSKFYQTLVFLIISYFGYASTVPLIEPETLLNSLQTNKLSSVNVLISMTEGPQSRDMKNELNYLRQTTRFYGRRQDRLDFVVKRLKNHANSVQKNVLNFLNNTKSHSQSEIIFKQLWVTNQIIVKNADLALIQQLILRTDIGKIQQEIFHIVSDPEGYEGSTVERSKLRADEDYEWGVNKINAPAIYNVTKGEGIVVASIDTGARWTHEALVDNYRADYGWFDAVSSSPTSEPFDDRGHGTHTIGTMVGSKGIGVAPGAQWISCKAGNVNGSFSSINILACGQWVICPTDYLGDNEDCSKAPHVVSNSWGGDGGRDIYDDLIASWRAAGIIPVFSIGNNGRDGCETAGYPGESPLVIGVGSTTSTDEASEFSSMGPIPTHPGLLKPEVSAPGSSVLSAIQTADDAYGTKSGTSMSCPHVTGAIALLLAKNPNLTYDQVKNLLQDGALCYGATGLNCGGVDETKCPNYSIGHGRIDAFKSFSMIS